MEQNEFYKKMETLKKPEIKAEATQKQIKLLVMNSKKSAAWGIWFLIVPVIFFASVAVKEILHWNWGLADNVTDWMAQLDRRSSFKWLTPVLLVLLPAIGAIINLLAVTHFMYEKPKRELVITIKLKWKNIFLALLSIAILGFVFLYGLLETAAERAIHRMEKQEQQQISK